MDALIERLNASGKWWMIGKGQTRPNEKLFGCLIQDPVIDAEPLATAEGDDLAECVSRALADLETKQEGTAP